MLFIIGGAYQGKHNYLLKRFERDKMPPVLDGLHLWVRARMEAGGDPLAELPDELYKYRSGVILCEDISCGVVPMSAEDRRWREETGRCAAQVSANAQEVVRLFCGIATRIK